MAEVKWIKITTNIFNDEKIKLIEQLPDGDSIIVIWFKLLCMAGSENNNGIFMMNSKIAYTEEMLATIFHRPLNTVRLALATFEAYGMIDIVDEVIMINNWQKHQNIEGLDKIREQNRIRQQRKRDRERQLLLEDKQSLSELMIEDNNVTSRDIGVTSRDCHVTVTQQSKKESKSKKENKSESEEEATETISDLPTHTITYESLCEQYGKTFVDEKISRAKKYANATIETVAKWCEEDYEKHKSKNNFNNFNQRQYDNDAIERMLLNKQNPPKTVADDPELAKQAEELKKMLQEKY